jgi:hypothetical protein
VRERESARERVRERVRESARESARECERVRGRGRGRATGSLCLPACLPVACQDMFMNAMSEFEIDVKKMPLGAISKATTLSPPNAPRHSKHVAKRHKHVAHPYSAVARMSDTESSLEPRRMPSHAQRPYRSVLRQSVLRHRPRSATCPAPSFEAKPAWHGVAVASREGLRNPRRARGRGTAPRAAGAAAANTRVCFAEMSFAVPPCS